MHTYDTFLMYRLALEVNTATIMPELGGLKKKVSLESQN